MTDFIPILPNQLLVPIASFRKWHLVLAQMLESNEAYRDFYLKLSQNSETRIILDNGAYELGTSVSDELLAYWAERLRPYEVVLPDVMKRGPETLDRTAGWLKQYGQRNQRYMIVPQSDNIFGWFVNLRKLLEGPAGEYTITIGVPKHMASLDSDGLGRLEILSTLHRRGYSSRHAVHLLGTDDRLQEPPHLDEFSWVRSFDSAKPAIWAYRCAMLDPRREPLAALPPFNRPDGFFDLEFPFTFLYMLNLTRWNINAVETWVRAGIPVAYGVY